MCNTCCPPAISALFCLWFRSGCRKSTVASTLTFFPPEPSFYKFERLTRDGRVLEDDEDADYRQLQKEKDAHTDQDTSTTEKEMDKEEENPIHRLEAAETHGQTQERMKSPLEILLDQAEERRKRAISRKVRDDKDVQSGVTYRLALDQRLVLPPFQERCIEAVKIRGFKGDLIAAVIYRSPQETSTAKTIIYSHGNATDLGAMFPLQVILAHSLKCHVVVYDYCGYGESGGVPDEFNTYRDIEAVYNYCFIKLADSNHHNIILYGQSVGSGPCCYLASKQDQIGGMILHSPFTSGMRVLTPSRLLACLDIFPNIERIKHVNCPVMVIHGCLDEEVHISHGMEMHNAVPKELQREPWWVPDRGHNDITEGRGKLTEYVLRLRSFLASLDG